MRRGRLPPSSPATARIDYHTRKQIKLLLTRSSHITPNAALFNTKPATVATRGRKFNVVQSPRTAAYPAMPPDGGVKFPRLRHRVGARDAWQAGTQQKCRAQQRGSLPASCAAASARSQHQVLPAVRDERARGHRGDGQARRCVLQSVFASPLFTCFTSRSAILSISLACRHGLARSRCALLAGFNMPKAEALPEPSKPSSSSS